MNEQKFSMCNLAVEMILLKVAALKSDAVKDTLQGIMKAICATEYKDEDFSEKTIALELDDIYEFGCLTEEDKDMDALQNLVESLMTELPNYEEYKKKYNWK